MNNIRIKTLVIGMIRTNCYVIENTSLKEAVIIDPADEAGRIITYLQDNDLVCKSILLTHGHFDHIMAAKNIVNYSGAKIYIHEEEESLAMDPDLNASSYFRRGYSLSPDILLKDNQILSLAGFTFKVIHTPGHTVGGVCYYMPDYDALFSGDTLFHTSIGRFDFPTGNEDQLIASIRTRLLILKDETLVYPGHGQNTTIGFEKENNLYL